MTLYFIFYIFYNKEKINKTSLLIVNNNNNKDGLQKNNNNKTGDWVLRLHCIERKENR